MTKKCVRQHSGVPVIRAGLSTGVFPQTRCMLWNQVIKEGCVVTPGSGEVPGKTITLKSHETFVLFHCMTNKYVLFESLHGAL